ncbi:DJ-1/PfpI family protein [Actinomyces sp. 2119]|uniref:DJ-1/PfpI family protein n=1 Tax=Actinomyces lilanjuaniae TaxID=2321394 RepID=A0ABM6Z4R0_9ACTO|nr:MULTISPECIES: DJ-1 family glyoxalase III [Actinomyces]AYD90190.1 DJ-1/PfpI family protein [Actinomyces lilanjuaniae]RJF41446.1 DJ-1/PfpI family protein [Actinomyces sp. 2119]
MPELKAGTEATDRKVAVFIAPGLEEVEALAVVDLLFRAGIPTDMVAVSQERAVTSSHNIVLTCDRLLAETDLADYDMLVLPGGIPGTPNLRACQPLMDEVTARVQAGRPVAAICAAPSILAELGLLEGREATSNPGFTGVLAEHGARVSQDSVVVDGSIITSRGMATAVDFGLEIVRHYLGDDVVADLKTKVVYQG